MDYLKENGLLGKKSERTDIAREAFRKENIEFSEHNQSTRFIISILGNPEVDFWPTSQKWWFRKAKEKGRGLQNLLNLLTELNKTKPQPLNHNSVDYQK